MSLPTVRIALLQDRDRGNMQATAAHTEQLIRQAAAGGAKIICTQELFLTEYFCWKQDSSFFDLAVPIPSEWTVRFQSLAKELSVVLILSLFERRAPGLSHNTAVVIDADGLEYISSAGLRVILAAQKVMNRQGSMVIKNVNETVQEVFDITGFSDILTIE